MPNQIGWSTEAYLLAQIKKLIAQMGAISGSRGITSLNGLTDASQTFAVGTAGAGFSISSAGGVHTFNIPNASGSAKGLLTAVDWTTFNSKIGGTGTVNYVPKFTASGTIGNSQIFDDGTNVGIGVGATPSTKFHVHRNQNVNADFEEIARFSTGSSTPTYWLSVQSTAVSSNPQTRFAVNSIPTGGFYALWFANGSPAVNRFGINSNGRFYVNPNSPSQNRFSIGSDGTVNSGGNMAVGWGDDGLSTPARFAIGANPNNTSDPFTLYRNGDATIRIENLTGVSRLRTSSNGNFSLISNAHGIEFSTNNVERMRLTAAGNLLIGTTADDGNRFQVAGTMINSTSAYFAISSGNVGIRQTIFGTSAVGTLAIGNGTAPTTSPADAFQLYSADVVAGNAAPHFRTENGAVVKVYQETTAVTGATRVGGGGTTVTDTDTFDGYTIAKVVRALRNQGLLA